MSNVTMPREFLGKDYNRIMEEAQKDLAHLDREFDRFFGNKESSHQMLTDKLFTAVNECVHYNAQDQIDVSDLLTLVPQPDRQLYADVCNFVYQFFDGKPASDTIRKQFCALLVRYLVRVGF